ncbi:MAG: hypothetical protein ACLP5H_03420, partial [Desulfomonilaceae bacterium]
VIECTDDPGDFSMIKLLLKILWPHSHGELLMTLPQTELIVGTPWRRIASCDGITTDSRVFMGES